jgi:hypothetical chaperone protein
MAEIARVVSIGIDFGTSNTVVALAMADGRVEAVRFTHNGSLYNAYASALCFWQDRPGSRASTQVAGGPWAIERMLEGHSGARFLQSFKTFAASRTFQTTTIGRQRHAFEDLLATFLRTMFRDSGATLDLRGTRIVVGRPVRFSGSNPDAGLAIERYGRALQKLGIDDPCYVFESVGAAFSFARDLTGEAIVLVADFGGGTSDFSVMRFSRKGGALEAVPLGHSGVGVAGDAFDARIVDHVVSPHFGKGGTYRSMGKVLPVPQHYFASLSRWNELAMMKGSGDLRDLRELARFSLDPDPLLRFIDLIEHDLGFALYRAVSAAKVGLSDRESVDFAFGTDTGAITATISRRDFEQWIAPDLARIAHSVDEALTASGITRSAVDKVFLTGGSSFVPAVRTLFEQRFGSARIVSADQFESIAYGLALIGRDEDAHQWAAA